VSRRREKIGPQRGFRRIEPARILYQREEAIMRYIFGGFSRSEHAIRKPEDGIAIALVQDLKRCRLAFGCVFQQPLVCLLIPQSKRSILQELSFLLLYYD